MDAAERNLIDRAVGLRRRALTPEQVERRRVVKARAEAIQAHVKAPASGTFGSKPR